MPLFGETGIRHLIVALAVVVTSACAAGGRARTGAPPTPVVALDTTPFVLRVPSAVGAFELYGRHDYEDRSLGTQLSYVGPNSLRLDAFVYPANPALAACGAVCGDSAVSAEAAAFVELIPEYLRRGYFGTATVASEEALPPAPGDPWSAGRHVALAATRDEQPVRSDYYLFLLRGYNVKVRATYPDGPVMHASVRHFASDIVHHLAGTRTSVP